MAKEELDRVSINASEAAVNVKQQDIALLLKKKDADDQQANKTEAEAPVDQAAVVETQDEALMVASADSVFASDGAYMVAAADGAGGAGGSGGLSTGTLLAIGGVALVGGGIAIAASDDDDNGNNAVPTAASASAPAVNEGGTVTFTVTGTPNATLSYVLTGVQAADVAGGVLAGNVVLDDNGNGVVSVTLIADNLTEGAETLTLTVDGATASVTVNDTSVNQPQTLTSAVETVNGTEQDDVFTGSVTGGFFGPLTGETLNAGDTINGLGGNDTLNADFQGGFGGALLADVTTNSVENINVSFNSVSGNDSNAIDAVTFNDVDTFNVRLKAPDSDGSLDVINLSGSLTTLSLDGADSNVINHSSSYSLSVDSGSAPLTIDNVNVSDVYGSFYVYVEELGNIPVINLSNVALNNSGTVSISVDATVGTGTNDTLTINADNAGFVEFGSSEETNVYLYNTNGDDVIENLAIDFTGNNYLYVGSTSVLETVTVTGSGEGYLSISDDSVISSIDSTGLAGDLELSTLSNTVDVTINLGAGNDYIHSHISAEATVNMGAGNDIYEQDTNGDLIINMGTGNDLLETSSSSDVVADMGDGNDVYISDGNLNSDDTVVGGAGIDILAVTSAEFTTTNMSGVSGFEVLATDSSGTYDMDALAGITEILVGGIDVYGFGPSWFHDPAETEDFESLLAGGTVVITNAEAALNTITINDDQASVTMTRDSNVVATAVTVNIGNAFSDQIALAPDMVTVGALTLDNEESITLVSTGDDDGELVPDDVNTITTLTSADLETLTVLGDTDLVITNAIAAPNLTKIDASAFTGDLTIAAIPATTFSVEFLGGSGDDTYNGTAFGDTINAGAGADLITLGAANAIQDTIIVEAGDSLAGAFDEYTNFEAAFDSIDVGAFGFTGQQASGLKDADSFFATLQTADDTTVIADFFNSAGIDRGVAVSSDGTDTFVIIDANKDGNFNGDTDLVMLFVGNADDITLANFGY